jgi:hypothetical protein
MQYQVVIIVLIECYTFCCIQGHLMSIYAIMVMIQRMTVLSWTHHSNRFVLRFKNCMQVY